jgi:hypothetical protein
MMHVFSSTQSITTTKAKKNFWEGPFIESTICQAFDLQVAQLLNVAINNIHMNTIIP